MKGSEYLIVFILKIIQTQLYVRKEANTHKIVMFLKLIL